MKSQYFLPAALLLTLCACGGGGGGDSDDDGAVTAKAEAFITGFPSFPVDIVSESEDRFFVAEVAGSVRLVQDRVLAQQPVLTVAVAGGGGLYGLALSPAFKDNRRLYIYFTDAASGKNRVDVYLENDGAAVFERTLIADIPAGGHDGGKMAFLKDGTLLVSTGDAGDPALSQDSGSLAGKILRLNEDGSVPTDNPSPTSPVLASGFRNIFGLALDRKTQNLFVTDNGPDCDDEVNVVAPGANYGWRPGQPCGDTSAAFSLPALRVDAPVGITGLTILRGTDFGAWDGDLLYGDFNVGNVTRVRIENGAATQHETVLEFGEPVLALHTTKDGEVFVTTADTLYRLVRGD